MYRMGRETKRSDFRHRIRPWTGPGPVLRKAALVMTQTGRRVWVFAAIFAVSAAACGDGGEVRSPSALGLGPWNERARYIFDDNIEPAAVGFTMDAPSARGDRFLRERAQTAELVARLKVRTVTIDTIGDESTYHLGVEIVPPVLVPNPRLKDTSMELVIRAASPAHGIAKALDQRMQGTTFVGFVHRFASPDGTETELHWHLSPDTADVLDAVKEAVVLGEASSR